MVIIILIGLIVIAIAARLAFLYYRAPRQFPYPKTAKAIAVLIGIVLITITVLVIFEDKLFSKRDVRKVLTKVNVNLTDEFKIIENRSTSAAGDYFHTFLLEISERDKQLIIDQIKSAAKFKELNAATGDTNKYLMNNAVKKEAPQNYEEEFQFVREYIEPSKQRYPPIRRIVKIDKKNNRLLFIEYTE